MRPVKVFHDLLRDGGLMAASVIEGSRCKTGVRVVVLSKVRLRTAVDMIYSLCRVVSLSVIRIYRPGRNFLHGLGQVALFR